MRGENLAFWSHKSQAKRNSLWQLYWVRQDSQLPPVPSTPIKDRTLGRDALLGPDLPNHLRDA